ncbi:tRNA (guanosine(46)-N7)-methyltransferase TrmB [Synechococcus sp. WH 8016]|jgi:tRNA (guanine-N7-)-methyltransferase|uniref:tRNA (guanosine(46)-N7)-methyltransferase TrmB n=1 Tax=Synechococcus sp. WH 8016 TaxID=166318 RepID=UPI00022D7EE5|nr:tRNA (guanosine(46)-N7)-methyltransferase TrmB [Synechococcus sp. WH 8016]EHA62229.1 tRNA (guanine-N(7)-)-methyltransferase [Synechococcus sp. WH 8016]
MRQHVNPLSRFFQLPLELPAPQELFENPNLPIHLDIGCARGFFLLELAALQPERNHLGVEIRRPLVQAAQRDRDRKEQHNLHFLFCNANISLEAWMAALPPDQLQLVSIQFPDPWFKQRHRKRRVLQPALLLAIASALHPGRHLFLQSDVLAVIEPMVALVELSNGFARPKDDPQPWRTSNPLPVATERERYVQEQGQPTYRVLFERTDAALPALRDLEMAWQQVDNSKAAAPTPHG